MAQVAGHGGVAICERESGCRVVKHTRCPGSDRVARCTLPRRSWKSGGHVIRHVSANCHRACKGRLVATVAVRRAEREVIAHMAGCTGGRRR